jgi:hypothetical protein
MLPSPALTPPFSHTLRRALALGSLAFLAAGLPSQAADFRPFPPEAFGVWGGGSSPVITWKAVEPRRGHYRFGEQLGEQLRSAAAAGRYVYLRLWVGPDSPAWIYDAGVPKADVPPHINPLGREVQHVYPYYLSAQYREHFYRLVRAFGDYVHSLPPEVFNRILFVQVCEGSTGDGQPYKSTPIKPEHRITFEQWSEFRLQTWAVYAEAFQQGRAVPLRLVVNADANREKENAWLLAHWKQIGLKQGMFSHGYIVSGTTDRVAEFNAFKAQARQQGAFVFTRGEQDKEWQTYGWSTKNPQQAFYWSGLFALQCGIDTWQVPQEALNLPGMEPVVQIFNRYAGRYDPRTAPGAFCALARGLDVSDTVAFPESQFGPARKNNRERYLAIAAAFASHGARMGDLDKALGHGMVNRKAQDYNDAGWKIWPGNYERFLRQIDPENTSVAWWHVEPLQSLYSRFARGFAAKEGRRALYFDLDDGFFAAGARRRPVEVRVVYLDRGTGSWRLAYHATGGVRTAVNITNQNTGQWRERTVVVADGAFGNGGPRQADLVLEHVAGDDTIFHLIEILRR